MASLNKVLLIGNLGRDPESRYMPSGGAVCNFSIATTERYKDKAGQQQEKTEWHNIVMYNKLAEIAQQYLKKGSQVYVEGRLQTRKWQDKNTGADRYTTEVVADEMKMLGGRGQGGGQAQSGGDDFNQEYAAPAAAPAQRPAPQAAAKPASSFDEFGEDIPF